MCTQLFLNAFASNRLLVAHVREGMVTDHQMRPLFDLVGHASAVLLSVNGRTQLQLAVKRCSVLSGSVLVKVFHDIVHRSSDVGYNGKQQRVEGSLVVGSEENVSLSQFDTVKGLPRNSSAYSGSDAIVLSHLVLDIPLASGEP